MNLDALNNKQLDAVKHIGGPLLVFAGAGSGKTRVLTHKIAYLIEEVGMDPENIMAVTFTNKAAKEMKSRVDNILSVSSNGMTIGTFHSISARILRKEIHQIGYNNDFTIYDQSDSKSVVKEVIKSLNLDTKQFDPSSSQYQISKFKNSMMTVTDVENEAIGYLDEKQAQIYSGYQETIKNNNALDFDDLILLPLELFKNHPDRLDYYQNKFRYILVDEYQDTNVPQFQFIYSLAKEHQDIFVVGDDDQSIYGWRGAEVENILNFSNIFANSTIVKLEQNYRSTQIILSAAHSIVSLNEKRASKELWTENQEGDKIQIFPCADERFEANKILDIISIQKRNYQFSEMVILYRTNIQSRPIEDMLRRNTIPYQIIGGVKFYDRKEVKDLMAYLRLIMNHSDSVAFERVVNFPKRGLGKTTIDKLKKYSKENNINLLAAINDIDLIQVGDKQKAKLREFYEMIFSWSEKASIASPIDIALDVVDKIGVEDYYLNINKTPEAHERWLNVEELINSIEEFSKNNSNSTLSDFLEEVSLLTDIDKFNDDTQMVTLMTIHSAKGLEFPLVVLAGLEEGLFPNASSFHDDKEMEEERRLFYVALTRAEKLVCITHASTRNRYGNQTIPAIKSRFIDEIPEEYIERHSAPSQVSSFQRLKKPILNNSSKEFQINQRVLHPIFGSGRIVDINGSGENSKLTIVFSGNVHKKFIKKYAKLKII